VRESKELAISTRERPDAFGDSTGLPLAPERFVVPSRSNDATIAFKASWLRAALPEPP